MQLVTVDTALKNSKGERISYQYDVAKQIKTNDDGLAFFVSQLAYIDARIYQTLYRNIVYQDFVPVAVGTDPEWADTYTYFSYNAVTAGKFLGANAKDLPESDLTASKHNVQMFYGGNAFSYSIDELRKSQQLRIPLDTTKGQMSFRGFQEHAQRVAFFGDPERNITGIWNNVNVASDNSTVDWDTATGQEIIDDMTSLQAKIWNDSNQVFLPNRFVIPSERWEILLRRMEVGTDTNILEYFKMNNLFTSITNQPVEVLQNLELNTAGVGSVQRMVAYEMNDINLTMRMPYAWRSLAPQTEGLRVLVPSEYKFGGVEFRYPGSAAYRDFI